MSKEKILSLPAGLILPMELHTKNNSDYYYPCPLSDLLFGCLVRGNCESICGEIDFIKFVVKSKPWQCEANIAISPPKNLLKGGHDDDDLKMENFSLQDLRSYPCIFNTVWKTPSGGLNF